MLRMFRPHYFLKNAKRDTLNSIQVFYVAYDIGELLQRVIIIPQLKFFTTLHFVEG